MVSVAGRAFAPERRSAPEKDVSPVASLDKVSVDIAVVLGSTSMPVHQALRLGRGAIIELDASEEDEVKILVNNLPVAKGTVVVSGNRIAVELKEMLSRSPDTR
jgi:flagellar motor switch protein FliN/FliY